jgi:hypothetical protein
MFIVEATDFTFLELVGGLIPEAAVDVVAEVFVVCLTRPGANVGKRFSSVTDEYKLERFSVASFFCLWVRSEFHSGTLFSYSLIID